MRVFRFAPSPNGYLHLGHAYSALRNADLAAQCEGRLLLRIEDIDGTRCRPEYEAAILEDLAWLGLRWEQPVRRQSEHFDAYAGALAQLAAMDLLYPSFESRADISRAIAASARPDPWPRDPDGAPVYPGTARTMGRAERERRVASGQRYALRVDMAAALRRLGDAALTWDESGNGPDGATGTVPAAPDAWGDVVIARSEVRTSYHLAVVADDALQGVTDVVRGEDLFYATSIHRLLQELLGLPAPRYQHHRLIRDADGRKLSKSSGSTALRALRENGATPADIRHMVGLAGDAVTSR